MAITNFEISNNPIYVPIRYYFLEADGEDWIAQAEADQRARNSIAMLNTIFNPQGIYFVPFDGGCAENIEARILQITTPASTFIPQYVRNNYPDVKLENATGQVIGMELYVQKGDNGSVEGSGEFAVDQQMPSTTIMAKGNKNGLHAIETWVLPHEIGHGFGLLHTHHTNCTCTVSEGCNCSDPDFCAGDFIDATPVLTTTGIPCDGSINSFNFMSYTIDGSCQVRFEPEQYNRMRAHLENDPFFSALIAQTTLVYNDGVPFTLPAVSGNIVVESGELVIAANQTLQMLPGASITVKRGARLRVTGKITGACGQMWRGIIVEGQASDLSQLPTKQGTLYVGYPGKIEHAQIAVDVESQAASGGGGIVICSQGQFANNTIGVRYGQYYGVNPNKGRIIHSKFWIDSTYRGGMTDKIVHVKLNSVRGIGIRFSKFLDSRVNCTSSITGVESDNATFVASQNNLFENLNIGIKDYSIDQDAAFSVEATTFRNCNTGIQVVEHSGFSISGNDFILAPPDNCNFIVNPVSGVTGVKISGTSNAFNLQQNVITGTEQTNPFILNTGTYAVGLGAGLNNIIKSNIYNQTFWGNIAEGNNGYLNGGLVYLCNEHNGIATDQDTFVGTNYWIRGKTSTIRRLQAAGTDGATGNLFGDFANNFGRLRSDTINKYDYLYYPDAEERQNPRLEIGSINGATPNILEQDVLFPNPTCANIEEPCPDPPCEEIRRDTAKWSFGQTRVLWINKRNLLATSPNPATTAQLNQEIRSLRLQMDSDAAKVLNSYRQDTFGIKTDSILAWLYRAETFGTRIELARHHYFKGNLATFDQLWNNIPAQFAYETDNEGIWERADALYQHFRNQVVGNPKLTKLSNPDIQYLQGLLNDCDEAGFIAQILLWRNGMDAQVSCDQSVPAAPRGQVDAATSNATLKLVPNPAYQTVGVMYPIAQYSGSISVMDLYGRIVMQASFEQGQSRTEVPLQPLSAGIYIVHWDDGHTHQQQKLVVQH